MSGDEGLAQRLATLERSHGEILTSLQHSMQTHAEAIRSLQGDMHRLVQLNEQQIRLAERAAEASKAIDRAFGTIKDVRQDIVVLVSQMETNWQRWRDKHEDDNQVTSDWANSARGGIRVLGVIGLVLWGILGTIAWDWRATAHAENLALQQRLNEHKAESSLRYQVLSEQVQELRISRGRSPQQQERAQ